MSVYVVTAAEAAARDQAAIAAGTPSQELMRRAGERAAHAIWGRLRSECDRGVQVLTGPGNNGGDGWIVARELQRRGARVAVAAAADPVTPEARWARASGSLVDTGSLDQPGVVVDALLGTGARGEPRGQVADAVRRIEALHARGTTVVALDIPTGLDAGSREAGLAVHADLTLSFGTWKRGLLSRRDLAGELLCIDIGLGEHAALADSAALAVDAAWVREVVPPIAASAHKGTRRRVMIVGAAPGMAGASVFAADGAFRSGVGMVRCCAHQASVAPLQAAMPQATVLPWPVAGGTLAAPDLQWPHAVLLGPGFGLGAGSHERATRWLETWRGRVVADADVLTLFAGDAPGLAALLGGRPAIATPHAVEASRLLGCPSDQVSRDPYAAAEKLSATLGCTVLLKGVPTIVSTPGARPLVVPRGTPVLATGGSGDLLAGIVVTLLAQTDRPHEAAAAAAFVHGRAAEVANAGRPVRGVTLRDVSEGLGAAWRLDDDPREEHELAWLPRVGERRGT
jgi:NAD(P)H-hydrate epimerase